MFPTCYWIALFLILALSITFDLGITSRSSLQEQSLKRALLFSSLWFALSGVVGGVVYYRGGVELLTEYTVAYLIELALSIDNVFVFILIFKYFHIERQFQHRVLFFGVIGAIFFRIVIIIFGSYIFKTTTWILLPFGLLLIYSGYKLPYLSGDTGATYKQNYFYRLLERLFHISTKPHKGKFIIVKDKKVFITTLGLALIMVEKADIFFALDSVPAVFSVTKNSFVAVSSNILAILGLRSMYFILSSAVEKFIYLKNAIGYILVYIGLKMILGFFGTVITSTVSVVIIVSIISAAMLLSTAKR